MPDLTTVHGIPYPSETDRPDVPADLGAIARRVDEILPQHFQGTGGPPNVGDTTTHGDHVGILRHGDVYYQHAT